MEKQITFDNVSLFSPITTQPFIWMAEYFSNMGLTEFDLDTKEENNFNLRDKTITWKNCRDGWGRPITHIICPDCGYELSGAMQLPDNSKESISYCKSVIEMYSDKSFIDVDSVLEDIRDRIKNN
jgi:hypothetical protein